MMNNSISTILYISIYTDDGILLIIKLAIWPEGMDYMRYWIEATRLTGVWAVMEDVGYAEVQLFSGSHEECVAFIKDLTNGED